MSTNCRTLHIFLNSGWRALKTYIGQRWTNSHSSGCTFTPTVAELEASKVGADLTEWRDGVKSGKSTYRLGSPFCTCFFTLFNLDMTKRDCQSLLADGPRIRSKRNPGPLDPDEYGHGEAGVC
ncbi:hypothetical protein EVAR_29898_1 [Eumeta japonica]|uniref:Uncharacterized protein n=1 Tax=Eumeta variegata TaxID=151549 RepID=A0A4C1V6R9_EUMVA|nr:hypothetical protein EVAR_29898_1 [Eumeta japonica]